MDVILFVIAFVFCFSCNTGKYAYKCPPGFKGCQALAGSYLFFHFICKSDLACVCKLLIDLWFVVCELGPYSLERIGENSC
jgi:hypothetical protein